MSSACATIGFSRAAFLMIFATVICGLLPAWQALKESINSALARERRLRLRRALVAAQIAISLVVLTTGFLFMRNLLKATAISPGFDVRQTLRADVNLPPAKYQQSERVYAYALRTIEALQAIPGIEAVAAARIVPFTDSTRMHGDLTIVDTGQKVSASFHWNAVTADYFRAMSIPLRQGRTFSDTDRGSMSAVVNEAFVRRYLGNGPAPGRTVLWGPEGKTPYRIVGVVAGTKNLTIGEDDLPQFYEPLSQIDNKRTRIQFVMRSATPPVGQIEAVRRALRTVEPAAGAEVATLYGSIGLAFLPSQVGAALLGAVGVLGLLLAVVGLYGTMVYSVARRTQEIGLRVAIGATSRDISRMILIESARIVVVGSVIGLMLAFLVTKPLAMFLVPGLTPADPISYAGVALLLAVTSVLASWGPARRAMAIEPAASLRYE